MSWVSENVLVANPCDIGLFIKMIKNYEFTFFAGLNTLFIGLMDHPDCKKLDFNLPLLAELHFRCKDWRGPSRLYMVPKNSSEKAESIISCCRERMAAYITISRLYSESCG